MSFTKIPNLIVSFASAAILATQTTPALDVLKKAGAWTKGDFDSLVLFSFASMALPVLLIENFVFRPVANKGGKASLQNCAKG